MYMSPVVKYSYPCGKDDPSYVKSFDGATDKLTMSVMKWAGLTSSDPVITGGSSDPEEDAEDEWSRTASYLNDIGALPFSEIAREISVYDPH